MITSIKYGLIVFLLVLPKAFLGLDLNDTGFHMYNGINAFQNEGLEHAFNYPFWWMSDYIAGFFYSLNQSYSLLINRIANAFFCGFNVFTVHYCCTKIYGKQNIPFLTFCYGALTAFYFSFLKYNTAQPFTFDYVSIPAFFSILQTSLIFCVIGKNNFKFSGAIIATITFLAINARLSCIFLLINILICFYSLEKNEKYRFLIEFLSIFTLLALILYYFLSQYNMPLSFQTLNGGNSINTYSALKDRFLLYLKDIKHILDFKIIISLSTAYLLLKKINNQNKYIIYLAFSIIFYYCFVRLDLICLSYCAFSLLLVMITSKVNIKHYIADILLVIVCMSSIGLGSDTGLSKTGAGIIALLFVISKILYNNKNNNELIKILNLSAIILLVVILKLNYSNNYLDFKTKYLNTWSKINHLKGILITQEQNDKILELENFKTNDYIYVYPHHPVGNYMLYNILDAKVIKSNFLFSGKCYDSYNEIAQYCSGNNRPELFIRSKFQPYPNQRLSLNKISFIGWCNDKEHTIQDMVEAIDNIVINVCKAQKIHENELFIVYR